MNTNTGITALGDPVCALELAMVHTMYTNPVPMVPMRNMVLPGYLELMRVAGFVTPQKPLMGHLQCPSPSPSRPSRLEDRPLGLNSKAWRRDRNGSETGTKMEVN